MDFTRATSPDPETLPAYFNSELDDEHRIHALLAVLTVEEKIACFGANAAVPRLGIRRSAHVQGSHGLALGGPGQFGGDAPIATTNYPQAVGLACTWDEEALREVATIVAHECRYYLQSPRFQRGGLLVQVPSAQLAYDPRIARIDEGFGEDPYLSARLTSAFVRGVQGDDPKHWTAAAVLTRFLALENEDARDKPSKDLDPRLFHEYFAVPFRVAVQSAGARAIQVASSKYHGIPLTTHPMLDETVSKDWGQDGILASDGRALRQLVSTQKQHQSLELAIAASIDAGISQFLDDFSEQISTALEKKLLLEEDLDRALRRNFRVLIRLGLLDPPSTVPTSSIGQCLDEPWQKAEHQESVRRVTQKSIVLLKNEAALLPLQPETLRQIAIIGPLADRVLCDFTSGTLPYSVSPVDGLRERLGFDRVILASNNDPSEAVCAARSADVAVICVGSHPTIDNTWARTTRAGHCREFPERQSIQLEDEELVKRVRAANPRTILVLISACPYAIDWSDQHVPAILHLSHNSQELGRALADVLFGDYNPAGRLVHTWLSSVSSLPPLRDLDIRKGRTYQYFKGKPLYPFGYGLSYTHFAYSRLWTASLIITETQPIHVSCDVTNIGRVVGEEVVQLYAKYLKPVPERAQRSLVGFRRVEIQPGETQTVSFDLTAESLLVWDAQTGRMILEPGPIELQVGRSSTQIELVCTISAQDAPSLPAPGAAATKRPSQTMRK